MSNLFKDLYNQAFYEQLADALTLTFTAFDRKRFMQLIFVTEFDDYELKQRMQHTTEVLHEFMPAAFADSVPVLAQIIDNLLAIGVSEQRLEDMYLPAYIETYGLQDYESAVTALELVTQFTSCEFAVRPFIIKYPEPMLEQMQRWSCHGNRHVRRLASEGSRPRLPWAMALPALKQEPTPLLPILSQLKNDECEVVRRSVANNFNDIAKDNPEFVVAVAQQWFGNNTTTDALVKHACRTLLKQAHPDIMALFGFAPDVITLVDFAITTKKVKMGDALAFNFSVHNSAASDTLMRLEYGLYYLKKNGTLARKVFKISERMLSAGKTETVFRQQSFKRITTRVFYPGEHELSIIVNGQEMAVSASTQYRRAFELII